MKKIKKNNIIKIILGTILLFVNITVNAVPVFGFSGSGSGNWTGGQYDSYMKTTESIAYNRGILVRKLTNIETKEKITVFCAEHTEDFVVGVTNSGTYYQPTDEKVKQACKIAYLGWYSKYGDYAVDITIEEADKYNMRLDYAFTQQYIWEVLEQSNATFINSDIQSQYLKFKTDINEMINQIEKRPSFNGQTYSLKLGEQKTITDSNNVLKTYNNVDTIIDNIRIVHKKGENTLTLSVNDNCKNQEINLTEPIMNSIGLIKDETKNNNTTVYLEFKKGVQNQLYSMNYNSPVGVSLNLQIQIYGKLELTKENNDRKLINGSTFIVTGPENFKKEVNVINGKVLLEDLKIGTYTITEKEAPVGYLINKNSYNIEVKAGETSKLKIIDEKPTGTIDINKIIMPNKNMDKSLINSIDYSKIEFKLTAKENIIDELDKNIIYKKGQEIKTFNLNKDGKAEITGLPMGIYELQETKTIDAFVLNKEKYEIKFEQKDKETKTYNKTINIENYAKVVEISKKDLTGDDELEGAKLFIIDENNQIIDNWVSKDNAHKIEGLKIGKLYTLREQIAPYGYNLCEDIKFTIEDNINIQKIEMKDSPILTNIQLEKIDSETKEAIKQSYFLFGIYEDEKCSKLITKVEAEQEKGTVLFKDLKYGTYYIKELAAPTGYESSRKIVKIEITDKGISADDNVLEEKDGKYSFKFYNVPLKEPQTGDRYNIIPFMILAITSFGFMIISINKKLFSYKR